MTDPMNPTNDNDDPVSMYLREVANVPPAVSLPPTPFCGPMPRPKMRTISPGATAVGSQLVGGASGLY